MRTNWRVLILTTVAAVGGAYILGVIEPVRAAEVTYNLESTQLSNGWGVTGSIEFNTDYEQIDEGSVIVDEGGENDTFGILFGSPTPTDEDAEFGDGLGNVFVLDLTQPLTGQAQTVQLATASYDQLADGCDVYVAGGGESGSCGTVPEPSSIMATVTAVTIGVVIRRLKRKI